MAEEKSPPKREPRFNDAGNGKRLVNSHGQDFRYVEALGGWHVWDGKRWVLDTKDVQMHRWAKEIETQLLAMAGSTEDEDLQKKYRAWANKSASAAGISNAVAMTRSEPGVVVGKDVFDANRRLLGVANGVVLLDDRRARLRRVHKREDYITRFTRGAYDRKAQAPRFHAWLKQVQPDPEVRAWLQRLAGYSLLGGNPERKLIVLPGDTSTGKTTFLEILAAVLGDYASPFNLSLFRVKQDEGPRADIVRALYSRLLYTAEASPAWSLHADHIKRSVGNDTMGARMPHSGETIERVPDFTPWLATNTLPEFSGADLALKRRMLFVPFQETRNPRSDDVNLRERMLAEETDGILTWIVDGWTAYRTATDENGERLGIATVPDSCLQANMDALDNLSHMDRFLRECCDRGPEYQVEHALLWTAYKKWCDDAGIITPQHGRYSENPFSSALNGLGIDSKRLRYEGGGDNKRSERMGLRLNATGEAYAGCKLRASGSDEDPS